jgi:signal transduction histidine kinase
MTRKSTPEFSAEAGVEWRVAKILILFRLLHAAQIGTTVPSVGASLRYPALGLGLLAAIIVESAWYIRRLVAMRQYGGGITAAVELASAIAALLIGSVLLPHVDRDVLATPLLDLSTEQLTAASLSRIPPLRLIGGGAAVVGSYICLILTGDPRDIGHVDALVGISGYIVIPVLIERGGQYLRVLAENLDRATLELAATSSTLAQEEERRRFATELHNYLLHTLDVFFAADLTDPRSAFQLRKLFGTVRERLRNYMQTGMFSEPVSFLDMLGRQVAQADQEGLTVQRVLPESVRLQPPVIPYGHVKLLEDALRAVLINVRTKAGADSAVLRATVAVGLVQVSVTDHGRGFPSGVLAGGPAGWRSLRRHQAGLRQAGGDLSVTSRPGMTKVLLSVPAGPPDPATGPGEMT